jgi:ribose-phosphate pyrophosphokinase
MNQIVIAGPASQSLALQIATYLEASVYSTENKVFADGEIYLRIEIEEDSVLENQDVIIVQTTGANASGNQNQRIMELIMMISAAKRANAAKIRVIVPYLAYSRQDKAFRPGESLIVMEILKWIETAGASEFYTIDLHAEKVFQAVNMPTFNLDPMEVLAQVIEGHNIKNPVVICPDKGAYDRTRAFASYLGDNIPVVQFSKTRDVKSGEITMEGDIDVNGRDVIIADDIIATGGTMARALEIAKKAGANSIYAVGTHPLLIKNAVFKLINAGTTEIIGADTIDSIAMQASMAEVIGKAIKKNK